MGKSIKTTTNQSFGKGKGSTEAVAVSDGDVHAAAVKSLHVHLLPDGDGWFAQGMQIDYSASGETIDEVKHNFAHGLCLTINEHLIMHGNIDKLLVPAAKEDWMEYLKSLAKSKEVNRLNLVTACMSEGPEQQAQVERAAKAFPFDSIDFIPGEPLAIAA